MGLVAVGAMQAVAAAVAVAGTGMSVMNSVQQGQQQRKSALAQAQVAANNAAIAEQNAKDAIVDGQRQEQRKRMEHNQRIGALRAQAGASGGDVGSGSALDTFADATMMKEYDSSLLRDQSERAYNTYMQQAAGYASQGSMALEGGNNAARNGLWAGGSSLLSEAKSSGWGTSGSKVNAVDSGASPLAEDSYFDSSKIKYYYKNKSPFLMNL
jgi:hypothetical protein